MKRVRFDLDAFSIVVASDTMMHECVERAMCVSCMQLRLVFFFFSFLFSLKTCERCRRNRMPPYHLFVCVSVVWHWPNGDMHTVYNIVYVKFLVE